MEPGGLQGELSHQPLLVSCRHRRGRPAGLLWFRYAFYPSRSKDDVLLSCNSQWQTITTQPMRSHYTSDSQFHRLFVCNSPSQLPAFLYERAFLSFVLWTSLRFCCASLVPNCHSLLLPNEPISSNKITYILLFFRLTLENRYLLQIQSKHHT